MKDLNYYLNLPYNMQVQKLPNDSSYNGEYKAFYKEYPKIIGVGSTEIEAVVELKETFADYIEIAIEDGLEITEPKVVDKKVRVNVLLPQSILSAIDKITNNRSKFLAESAKKLWR